MNNSISERLRKWAKHLKLQTYALYLAYRDNRTPWYAKAFGALVVAYALSPIDLIPDFVPILGYLDDLIIVPLGIALAIKMIPKEVMDECYTEAERVFSGKRPTNWIAGSVVIGTWAALVLLIAILVIRKVKA